MMPQGQHTPGPWQVARRASWINPSFGWWSIEATPPAERVIAEVTSTEANALLIAAAPDLLAELERLARVAEAYMHYNDSGSKEPRGGPWAAMRAAVHEARAAIDRAITWQTLLP